MATENFSCSTELPWSQHQTRTRVRPRGLGKPKKPRSRSSPVRLVAPVRSSLARRPRSPSVSPPRVFPSRPPSPYAECDVTYYNFIKQSEGLSVGSAYFSNRPPPEPIRLVVLEDSGSHNILPPASIQTPSDLPGTSTSLYIEDLQAMTSACIRKSGYPASWYLVRRLLADLTEHLPITTEKHESNVDIKRGESRDNALVPDKQAINQYSGGTAATDKHTPVTPTVDDVPVDSSFDASPAHPDQPIAPAAGSGDYRDVAVQAPKRHLRHTRNDVSKTTKEAQASLEVAPTNGWIGDVRALRDSHVRLIRRQLRHIACLNRTLDHVENCPQSTQIMQARCSARIRSPCASGNN
ncbi:unnamed protein product [Diatraea saccharalis]|uniref:Uncharacterized protein n=1 Tax=Diatraea saccharalis TaxID=40085 RepID=A0A9N9QPJ3_9NEOP|nr:unnamed protein product [Diatraea saccharalis]